MVDRATLSISAMLSLLIAGLVLVLTICWATCEVRYGQVLRLPIYIVSLKELRPERTLQILLRIGEDPQRRYFIRDVSAVDGRRVVDEGFMDHPGAIGCFLSHLRIWGLMAADSKHDAALVLEDDADLVLPRDWDSLISATLEDAPEDWELIWLGATYLEDPSELDSAAAGVSRRLLQDGTAVKLLENRTMVYGTHAYLLRRAAAQRLYRMNAHLQTAKKRDFANISPVDVYLSVEVDLRQYIVDRERLVGQRRTGSDTSGS
jgi:GR25 family glycosyltransferase involved in LPS biosynthesis